jgi:dimethylhistidine N-methyltransferase
LFHETMPGLKPSRLTIVQGPGEPGVAAIALADAVRRGLESRPRTLPWTFFYDEAGSRLFEAICRLPEYYLTRTEDAILRAHAGAMVDGWTRSPALVELGSGSASKTRRLIGAALKRYGRIHYVPIDVSPTALVESAEALVSQFPDLRVTAFAASYRGALQGVAARVGGPRLWIFLGSSLGNYAADEAVALLAELAAAMGPDDRLLLGTDLVKDPAVLEAAYDDAQGVTAQFNLNLLVRINRELGADFDLDQFAHRAVYRADVARVEMHLVSRADQVVQVPGANLSVHFFEGETIHTENSHKYTPETLAALAARAGFAEEAAWTDPRGFFRLQRWQALG